MMMVSLNVLACKEFLVFERPGAGLKDCGKGRRRSESPIRHHLMLASGAIDDYYQYFVPLSFEGGKGYFV